MHCDSELDWICKIPRGTTTRDPLCPISCVVILEHHSDLSLLLFFLIVSDILSSMNTLFLCVCFQGVLKKNQKSLKVSLLFPQHAEITSAGLISKPPSSHHSYLLLTSVVCQAPAHRSGLAFRRLSINFLTTAPLGTRPRGSAPGLIPHWPPSTQLMKRLSCPTRYTRHCTFYQKVHHHL